MIYDVLNPAPGLGISITITADGTADDYFNLQAIINHVSNQGGGTVLFPAGKTVALENAISLRSNVSLISSGQETIIKIIDDGDTSTTTSTILSTYGGVPSIGKKNITIKGLKFISEENSLIHPINLTQSENITIEECTFFDLKTTEGTFYIKQSKNITIKNCISESPITNPNNSLRHVYMEDCENIIIDGYRFLNVLSPTGILGLQSKNITISNCVFSRADSETNTLGLPIFIDDCENVSIVNSTFNDVSAIQQVLVYDTKNVKIKGCDFKDNLNGIVFDKQNDNIKIEDNYFVNLTGNNIRIQGGNPDTDNSLPDIRFSNNVWITGNRIVMMAQANDNDFHGIYMTCGDTEFNGFTPHFENVVVANNVITGPGGLSNANGGTADLFSLKDIIRLKCYGNTARNSGDLGYAIERCHSGVVSNNTADKNNSCGISVYGSSHMSVTGNVCSHNEQNHDYDPVANDGGLGSKPYGGIRVEFDSVHILLSGNHFFGTGVGTAQVPATQSYGIVVKSADLTGEITNNPIRSPYNIKIGVNHYVDHSLGDIYDAVSSTIIEDSSATVATP